MNRGVPRGKKEEEKAAVFTKTRQKVQLLIPRMFDIPHTPVWEHC
jgi:hypothetical protein